MPLLRYMMNKAENHAQQLHWGAQSVSSEDATVYYSDVSVVSFYFTHSTHSTNFVKNDDTLSYFIQIDDIVISRSHSAFNRVSSNAKAIANDIQQEFEGHMQQVYRHIVPGLFMRKAHELVESGEVEIASLKFKRDGAVVIDGSTYRLDDLKFGLANGQWYIANTAKKTFFGKPKHVATIPIYLDNAVLIEPILKFARSL